MPALRSRTQVAEVVFNTLGDVYHPDAAKGKEFNIEPTMVQTIEKKIQESNAFLNQITVTGKASKNAQIINTSPKARITKRTASGRRPTNPMGMDDRKYDCETTEKDALISWEMVDDWRGHTDGEIYVEYRNAVVQAIANDQLKVGWWGQYSAATTDQALEYLEDQQEGWLAYAIRVAPEKILGVVPDATAPRGYTIQTYKLDAEDPSADFKTLDQLVYHVRMEKLHPLHQERTDVRSIIGSEMIQRESFRLYGISVTAQERNQLAVLMSNMIFGETPHVKSDFFPRRGGVITPLKNIARYYLMDSYRRRAAEDDHNMKGIVDYNYNLEDHVINDMDAFAGWHPDAILLKNPLTGEWEPATYQRTGSAVTTWKV
ncbi:P2 family phage major capsid protein [Thiothrix sp.]|jgi:P2 family phage major capsid protein|uniref:P2 family phage major capsid protein n=1 Tax=Thiothrix sp. TaxID=1032 RepID=UPI00257D3C25|nr:P2 family phage major capsid protein [Thiothrix sp.]